MTLLTQCGNTVFSQTLLLKQFPFCLNGSTEHWYYTLPRHSIANWDDIANRFYRTFYTPQLVHLDARTRDEGASNEAVMLPLQTPPGINADVLINVVLDLKPLPAMRPRNLFQEEV